jgi:hypothetical protein
MVNAGHFHRLPDDNTREMSPFLLIFAAVRKRYRGVFSTAVSPLGTVFIYFWEETFSPTLRPLFSFSGMVPPDRMVNAWRAQDGAGSSKRLFRRMKSRTFRLKFCYFSSETVNRLRPFFLLLLRTSRPPLVDILFLNPWAFDRFLFDG